MRGTRAAAGETRGPSALGSAAAASDRSRAREARAFGLLGVVAISFSAIFVRLARVSPSTAAFFRAAYALPVLALVALAVRGRSTRTRAERGAAFVAGLFLAADLTVWHRAIADIGAGLATVLANTQVVFVALAAWLLYRERPTRIALVLVPLVFGGVVLMSGIGGAHAYGARPLWGAGFGTAAGIFYTGFLLVFRRANRSLAHPAGPLLDATLGTVVGSLAGSIFDPAFSLAVHLPAHAWLVALALSAQVFGWLSIAVALPRLAALETSVMLLLQPLCTMFWGFLVFRELLSGEQLLGAAIVLAGVGTLSVRGAARAPVAPERVA
jgi:drug/metabolite transporter (DMT)-like permease